MLQSLGLQRVAYERATKLELESPTMWILCLFVWQLCTACVILVP